MAASTPTAGSRRCLLAGQRRKHSSVCLTGHLPLHEDQRNREKVTSDNTAILDNKPPPSSPYWGPQTTGSQEGPTHEKHTCRFPQGGFCSSQQLACPHRAGTGTPRCLSLQHINPYPRSDCDLQPRRPHKEQEKMTPPLTLPLWKDPGAATVSGPPSMDSWLGPTRRGTVDKQLSPAGSGRGGQLPAGGWG